MWFVLFVFFQLKIRGFGSTPSWHDASEARELNLELVVSLVGFSGCVLGFCFGFLSDWFLGWFVFPDSFFRVRWWCPCPGAGMAPWERGAWALGDNGHRLPSARGRQVR